MLMHLPLAEFRLGGVDVGAVTRSGRLVQRVLGGNDILTLNEAADVLACRDVLESDIDRHIAKQRDTGADQHWNARDDEPMNEPSSKKSLDGDPAIYVNVPNPAGGKPRHDFRWCPRHMLHYGLGRSRSQRVTAEHDNRLLAIWPSIEVQDRLVSLAAHDQRIHRSHELLVPVGFAAARRQEV